MKQMKVAEDRVIQLNYEDKNISLLVKELQPVVFQADEGYNCILGPDMQTGVVGYGDTIKGALASWESAMKKRMERADDGDEVALYATDMLQASNKKVW
ncbi:hypothetical protein JHJ32_00470 [Parapedobacter sp. ISTM3]|nr:MULTISPECIES: hypothetical protein [Parapedobacter]MBK1438445.1 hypothetical protein [Parapedobacter sp. ISTM3]